MDEKGAGSGRGAEKIFIMNGYGDRQKQDAL
jgi:hypothetical protein